ncbi:MAG: GtrA family protein [Bacillales bacterium]|nr:GtrA family protein [Bacillales bacterium]
MKKIISIYKKYEEIINYIIVGGLTTLVSLASKWILLFTVLDAASALELQIAVIISWICAVSFAYITNRIFVFKSNNKNILKEITSFFGARTLTLLLEMVIMWFFVTLLRMNSDTWVLIWTILSQFIILVLNYVFSKIFVFKK